MASNVLFDDMIVMFRTLVAYLQQSDRTVSCSLQASRFILVDIYNNPSEAVKRLKVRGCESDGWEASKATRISKSLIASTSEIPPSKLVKFSSSLDSYISSYT